VFAKAKTFFDFGEVFAKAKTFFLISA